MTPPAETFELQETVLAEHGPALYEAKIIEREQSEGKTRYKVHYCNWNKSWDEWLDQSYIKRRTEEAVQEHKRRQDEYEQAKLTKRAHADDGARPSKPAKMKRGQMTRDEMKISLTTALKKQLIVDWQNVTKHKMLVSLPRQPTVSMILDEFVQHKSRRAVLSSTQDSLFREFSAGIKQYFNKALGTILLYRFERLQYADILKEHRDKHMCDIYGAEHLLRLFVKLPSLLSSAKMDAAHSQLLHAKLAEFVRYLNKLCSSDKQTFIKTYNKAEDGYMQRWSELANEP